MNKLKRQADAQPMWEARATAAEEREKTVAAELSEIKEAAGVRCVVCFDHRV